MHTCILIERGLSGACILYMCIFFFWTSGIRKAQRSCTPPLASPARNECTLVSYAPAALTRLPSPFLQLGIAKNCCVQAPFDHRLFIR